MKKMIPLLIVFALFLAACGGGETPAPTEAVVEETAPEPTEEVVEEPTEESVEEATEEPTKEGFSVSLELNFDSSDDLQEINVTDENLLQDGSLNLANENLQDIILQRHIAMGDIVHTRMRIAPNGPCFFVTTKMNAFQPDPGEKLLRFSSCPNQPYTFEWVTNTDTGESSEEKQNLEGGISIRPEGWFDTLFWLNPDGQTLFALAEMDGQFETITYEIPEDWQSEEVEFIIGVWPDQGQEQYLDVDFIRVAEGSLEMYIAEYFPTYGSQSEQTSEETNPDENTGGEIQGPETIVAQWLNDAEVVFSENVEAMAQNDGGQFGPGARKEFVAEGGLFAFSDEGGGIWTPLNTRLDEFGGMEANGEQAILIRFQPLPPFSLSYTFMGPNEFGIDFYEGGKPSLFWFIEAYKEPFDGNLSLQEGGWYYALMAMDRDGKFRSVIWEDGNPDNNATFSGDFSTRDQGDGYKNQSWKFIIGSNAPMTLNVAEYKIYNFSGFVQ